ncbi:MAG: SDR family NAD(P)-dependent oxidoreductase [Acidimicrobiales bacterium]
MEPNGARPHHRCLPWHRRCPGPGLRKGGAKVSSWPVAPTPLKSLADELDGFIAFTADLLDPDQVDELIARVELEAGPIDVLVNNAGLETSGAV